jgi:glycine dehydrogenase subunit 1
MGPQGMQEIGRGIMQRARYAMQKIAAIPRVRVPFVGTPHFKEFVVDFNKTGKTVADINKALHARGIFGGSDLSVEFPALGQSALYCITEVQTQADIDRLVSAIHEVVK